MTSAEAPAGRWDRLAELGWTVAGYVPLALTVLAEASWIAVLAALVQEYVLRPPVLDVVMLTVFVVAGLLLSRATGVRFGGRWPAVALGLMAVAAVCGVFVSAEAWKALDRGGLGGIVDAIAAHPGGLLAGMALLRGIAWGHAGLPLPEDRLIRLLGGGLIAVTLAAIAGSLVSEPFRGRFLVDALGAGLMFGASAIVALALTRQAIAAGDVAAAWHRNPIWVVALLMLVTSSAAIALAASGQVRPAIELIVAIAAAPFVILGLIGGWTRRTFRVVFLLFGAFVVLGALGSTIDRMMQGGGGLGTGVGVQVPAADAAVAAGVAGLIALVVILVVLLLVRLWMRQFRIDAENPIEERYVDRADEHEPRRRRRLRLPFTDQPTDAVTAYRALVADLADRRGVRREAWETPHEHASRMRSEADGDLGLDLLAADYALASFGGVSLSPGENRRALGRWRRLRRRLQARPEPTEEELGPAPL